VKITVLDVLLGAVGWPVAVVLIVAGVVGYRARRSPVREAHRALAAR
jgi:hypothetical protein